MFLVESVIASSSMELKTTRANWLSGLVGAALGGAVGYAIAYFLGKQGFYMPALPGALLGVGCGMLSGGKSVPLGIVCGLIALPLGVVSQWHINAFKDDPSLLYFFANLKHLGTGILSLIALGAVFAAWIGTGRRRVTAVRESSPEQVS
jgi:hypothetical protein